MDIRLKAGYELSFPGQHEKYIIMEVIGRGASTIAYRAKRESGMECILKEYCPHSLSLERTPFGTILCREQDSGKFEQGKQDFVTAGELQKQIRNTAPFCNETPLIYGTYATNNTIYLEVTPHAGKTLDQLSNEPVFTKIKICLAIAKLVGQYHQHGFLCLDVKPDNVFVLTNSSGEIVTEMVEYIDFDSVRQKSDLAFGKSISFTELWSAPEQTNPYSCRKICEATDIYTLGELVFWCVFGRHSRDSEHRDFSVYPFREVRDTVLSRTAVQNVLSKLFHSTIRSSIKNRLQSVNQLLPLLAKLIVELGKKEYIIESAIHPKDFFIGRTTELRQIDDAFHMHDIVFVSGIAGIGKSELVKQYVQAHKKEYDSILYWTYDGNLDSAIARETTIRVCGLLRIPEETDFQYANRMLRKIRELSDEHNYKSLIVIDNLNCLVEELPSKETWEQIQKIQGKILLTTRASEFLYQTVEVGIFSNPDDLIRLFGEYCPFPSEERASVCEIIDSVDKHTLLVEMLAHHTKATHTTPSITLQRMQDNGISNLSNESIRILKDETLSSSSIYMHINKIFSMESISDDSVLILAFLAFLPADGVLTSKFTTFYSLENYENLNWLIHHGWVSSISESEDSIRIHPAIATVVIAYLKTKPAICDELFARNYRAIRSWNPKCISEAEKILYANSLALSTVDRYGFKCRSAAIFVEQYVRMYLEYGGAEQKLSQIDFVIDTLTSDKYSAVLEEGYYLKANILWTLWQYETAIHICEEHLVRAKKAKDTYFIAKWYLMLSGIYHSYRSEEGKPLKFYFVGYFNSIKLGTSMYWKKSRLHYYDVPCPSVFSTNCSPPGVP